MVYVDDMYASYGRMKMCHMIADSQEELLAAAARIGVAARWIQYRNTYKEHFDICTSKRKQAVAFGAREVTMKELARIIDSRRNHAV